MNATCFFILFRVKRIGAVSGLRKKIVVHEIDVFNLRMEVTCKVLIKINLIF